jgi:hypothetical protein
MAKRILLPLTGVLLLVLAESGPAQEVFTQKPATCEPGYVLVEDVEYREVCKKVCRIVPIVRKIKVPCYDMKCDYICKRKCGKADPIPCRQKCDCMPRDEFDSSPQSCNWCRERRQLVKREVEVEHHHYACVVEEVVEQVPCKVWRKVPCDQAP